MLNTQATRLNEHEPHHALQELPLPSSKQRRLDGVQMLRAVAVLSVAWLHAGQITALVARTTRLPDLGLSGVDLFFVISGFILCLLTLREKAPPGPHCAWNFLQRRIARIFPIYWIFAARDTLNHLHHSWPEIRHYAPAFFLLPGYAYPDIPLLANFSWTLIFEMFFYLVLASLLLFTVRRATVALIAVLGLSVAAGVLFGAERPIIMVISNPMLLEFAFGALIASIYVRNQETGDPVLTRRIGWALLAAGTAAGVVLGLTNPRWIAPYQNQILLVHGALARALTWGVACALVLAGVVFISPSLKSHIGRAAVALGNASYSTYLLSGMALPHVATWAYAAGKSHQTSSLLLASLLQITIVTALMCAGLVFYAVIERPIIRYSYHLISGRKGSQAAA